MHTEDGVVGTPRAPPVRFPLVAFQLFLVLVGVWGFRVQGLAFQGLGHWSQGLRGGTPFRVHRSFGAIEFSGSLALCPLPPGSLRCLGCW